MNVLYNRILKDMGYTSILSTHCNRMGITGVKIAVSKLKSDFDETSFISNNQTYFGYDILANMSAI